MTDEKIKPCSVCYKSDEVRTYQNQEGKWVVECERCLARERATETGDFSPIGGNWAILCVRKADGFWHRWIDRERHWNRYEDIPAGVGPRGQADGIKRFYLKRFEVVSEDDMTSTVRYSCHDRCDHLETPCGFIDVTWRRGRTYNGVDELAPFERFGAGIGYEGSDYVISIEPLFFTKRLDKDKDVSNDNLRYPYIVRERINGKSWGRAGNLDTAKLLLLSLEDTDRDFNRAELNKYEIYNSTTGKTEQGDQND